MATSFGTSAGVFGIAAQQTGFLLESTSDAYSQDSTTCKNITGDDIGETYFNERIEGSLDGWLPASSAFSGTLASALTLATTPADHLIGAVTGGTTIVLDITRSSTSADYRRLALNWKYSPTILA
jgi:hypothetical protein